MIQDCTAISDTAQALLNLYPRIYFACHTRHVRDPLSQRLLSRHQASVLDHLDELEPTTLMDLSRHMGVTAGTMSVTVDRLERKGYVVRLRDAADKRKVHLRLTSAGVRVRDASSVLDVARVEALVRRLSDAERQRAIDGLRLLAHAAQEQMHAEALREGDRQAKGGRR
jgi:DNA-binding MarR family transcriptional regulator